MKKGFYIKLVLTFIFFIFLLYGVSASSGTCKIVQRSSCIAADGNYIIMGLSASTNAHGEFPDLGTYPYVLCCGLPQTIGNTTCKSDNSNTIIKLSSSTNAHAESPTQSNYPIRVCFEDFSCISTSSSCGTGDATNFPLGILSLYSSTNAHIGNYSGEGSYLTKICCGGKSIGHLSCDLESAAWNLERAIENQNVRLEVIGNGPQCDDASLSFEVWESDPLDEDDPVITNPSNVAFNGDKAIAVWTAEWQDDGLLGGDPDYYFIATIKGTSKNITSSDPKLKVTKTEKTDYCTEKTDCSDYTVQEECESDSSLCNLAQSSGEGLVDCSNKSIECMCRWDGETSACEFGYSEITECGTPEEGCAYGCTLCHNAESDENYCNIGATCPSGDEPSFNGDEICDFGEGCTSDDCVDGDQDTCSSDTYCSGGKCSSVEFLISNNTISLGSCKITQSIEKACEEAPTGYKIVSWTGIWDGEQSGDAYNKCIAGGTSTIPCPAQLQLPFFDYYEMIISLIAIAGIYLSLIVKKKILKK